MYRKNFKRSIDFTTALLGLILLSPLLLILAVLILWKMGWPIFFTQERLGRNERPFRMIKFRTMANAFDSAGNLLPNELRQTKFGNFLRSASLDELPGLFNVLKGDMSLVGPRPLLMDYQPLYNDFQRRRHEVRPGITGWAQVNGRNAISWEQKFEHDVWYVNNQSLWLDIRILWMTVRKVFKREGITAADGGFTEPFRGSKET